MNITKTTLLRYLIGTVVCAFSAQTISAEGTKLPYWKDIQTVAVNKEAPRTAFMSYDNSGQALTGKYENSPYYKLLNGKWNFYYVDAYKDLPANIEQPGADITWKEINVPGNWEVQGYGTAIYTNQPYDFQPSNPQPPHLPEANPVGVYQRDIEIPSNWDGRDIYLRLEGAKSGVYVYLNGKEVGYSEDSKNPAEFLINKYLQPGKNSSILINVLAFSIALALTKGFKGTNVFRTVFFMPNLIGGIVLGYIWQTLLNGLLSMWGQPLLKLSATNGFIGMIILLLWQQIGYMMIIYVAGLNNVSPDLIEAAQIDGATATQILFKIKIPMIMPSVTICTFLTLTNGFKMFDQNLSLTGGDPGKQSQLLALNIYDTFYGRSGPAWKGIGQAKAVVFFVLVVAIALIQLRATSSKEVQA